MALAGAQLRFQIGPQSGNLRTCSGTLLLHLDCPAKSKKCGMSQGDDDLCLSILSRRARFAGISVIAANPQSNKRPRCFCAFKVLNSSPRMTIKLS